MVISIKQSTPTAVTYVLRDSFRGAISKGSFGGALLEGSFGGSLSEGSFGGTLLEGFFGGLFRRGSFGRALSEGGGPLGLIVWSFQCDSWMRELHRIA